VHGNLRRRNHYLPPEEIIIYLRPPSTSFPSPQMPAWEGGWGGGGAVRIMAWRGKREEKGSVWEGALDTLPSKGTFGLFDTIRSLSTRH